MTRILVCGSRTFKNQRVIDAELDFISDFYNGDVFIIHGKAKGADTLAGLWAENNGKPFREFPADWIQHGKRAGFLRNTQMLVEGKPDAVVAFVDKPLVESKGTKMMVDIARTEGVPCRVVEHIVYVLRSLPDEGNTN